MRQLIKAGLGFNASSCHLLARLGMGTKWPPLASWFMEVHASSLPFRSASGSTFTFPFTPILICHCSGLPGLRNNKCWQYVTQFMCQGGTALVSPWVAGKFRGYREIHWVWMFLSLIPSLDDDGNQSVVNIYIYAFTLFQVSCLRIRPFNTSQSDQMIERNKATFPRMEEFIYLFIIFVQWWADGGVASLHVLSVNIQVLFMWHLWTTDTKLLFEFSQVPGWYQPRSLRWERKLPNTSRQLNLTVMWPQAAC